LPPFWKSREQEKMRLAAAFVVVLILSAAASLSAETQWVEGFDSVQFHHNANGSTPTRDFRGPSRGYMTAGWWAPGQMKQNYISWKTARVPAKEKTTFVFVGATSVLPAKFSRGPSAKLSVNGHDALTFTIGFNQDHVWKEGDYELKYISKRVEFPYFGSHRELRELNGNSGLFQLTVPAAVVSAGQAAVLKVEILPFAGWNNGWFMVKERRDALKQSMDTLEAEIESLRQDVTVLNKQTHILATKAYPELTGAKKFEHTVIYHNGFRHLHPADLVKLQNGELLVMAREGAEHISKDGDVILLRSSDHGRTWGGKQVIAGIKNLDEREGCGIQLKDGTVVVGVFYNNLYDKDGVYKPQLPAKSNAGDSSPRRRLGAYIITSKDNGHTWSEPNYIDTAGMPFTNLEGPTDAPIEMPDGSILMAVIAYQLNGDSRDRASVMLRSADKGKTWKYLATIADDPGGKLGGFLEPGIVRTKTGRILAALRNHGPDGAIWVTHSDDNGKTWSAVQKTEMIGQPVDLLQLADGRVMATYGIRSEHSLPGGIRACFSRDNGQTWDIQSEVQLRNDFLNWDVGYPESLELADGRVLTVYYFNLFNEYFLGGTFWRP
jgi:sialidase-1